MARHHSPLEEGETRRDSRPTRHHRSSRDRDSRRRRADTESSESDREMPKSKTDREVRRRRHDERDPDIPDRDSKRRVDRRREGSGSSESEEDREEVRRRQDGDNGTRYKRRRHDSDSSESEKEKVDRRSDGRRHDRYSPKPDDSEKHKIMVDEGIEIHDRRDMDLGRGGDKRKRDRDSSKSEEDLERRRSKVDGDVEIRDTRGRDSGRGSEVHKSKVDGDDESRDRRNRDSSRGDKSKVDGDDESRDRDSSRGDKSKVDGDDESRDRRDRDSSRGDDRRRHDRDSSKSEEDLEKCKSKVDGDGELRDRRDRDSSRRGDRRRHDRDSPKSDDDVEKTSLNKREHQNGGKQGRNDRDRDRDSRRGDRRRRELRGDSSEEEDKSKGRSRSELGKVDERARREDNYRGRGTDDENYMIHEKRVERRRDERFLSRVDMDDEDIKMRRERDGYKPKEDDDGKKVGNQETGNDGSAALGRTGGVYIPPFKLAQMMKNVEDKSSVEYQRLTWDALRKSINGLVNKVNAANIKNIVTELFEENLIRGRGLFCRSCMKSQMASPTFTDVFSALVAVVNTKFPEVGELLLRRIILQLKRAYKRNDKHQLLAAVKFIAHLVNQQVAHEIIALELLTVLLENPTDDSVEVAVGFITDCGSILQDLAPKGLHGIFERFRGILHEGEIDKRVQYLIEGLFAIRKAKFQGHPAVRPELDLVDQEDQLTHELSLESEIDPETSLDIFKPDPNFLENEKRYEELVKNILGDESDKDEESSVGASDGEEDEDSDEEEEEQMKIKDETETNLVNLRRTIYLTIMSSATFEEAGHKLLKIKLEPGQEMELCIMLLECCSQERTYLRYYGLLGQRFCMINRIHQENFEKCFVQQYSMIHRLETNKLRNVAKFFAHLLGTDALPWHVLSYIRLTEEDTTSSSRIFIKILFQELSEHLGIRLLNERLTDPTMQDSFESIFPKDNPKNTRFSINFFTSIGLGGITEALREYLKNMPRMIMQQQMHEGDTDSGNSSPSGSSSSSSSSSSDSSSSSESEEDVKRKRRRRK